MIELVVVIGMVASILAVRWMVEVSLPGSSLTLFGLWVFAAGIVEGIPSGLYYHILLYRVFRSRGEIPAGWWISPSRYHARLSDPEKRVVLRWFFLGGLGFLLCITGGVLALSGIISGTMFPALFEP
jgi:hypothetical protein